MFVNLHAQNRQKEIVIQIEKSISIPNNLIIVSKRAKCNLFSIKLRQKIHEWSKLISV